MKYPTLNVLFEYVISFQIIYRINHNEYAFVFNIFPQKQSHHA